MCDPRFTESARVRARKETVDAIRTVRFWIVQIIVLSSSGGVASYLAQNNWSGGVTTMFAVGISVVAAFLLVAMVFGVALVLVPVKQRNEARAQIALNLKSGPLEVSVGSVRIQKIGESLADWHLIVRLLNFALDHPVGVKSFELRAWHRDKDEDETCMRILRPTESSSITPVHAQLPEFPYLQPQESVSGEASFAGPMPHEVTNAELVVEDTSGREYRTRVPITSLLPKEPNRYIG